ncbi:hypothetical protein [Alienimonas sp. DA493]|uniref:hypothetical protein n=1 Tax=Alienimonas sp. DA493 TaxID=3373605 RepID=UPI00375400D0
MTTDETLYRGSIKAGWYTAQLGSGLVVSPEALTLKVPGRAFTLRREHFRGTRRTARLGIFKRGVVLEHDQPDLPAPLVVYPSCGVDELQATLAARGWAAAA